MNKLLIFIMLMATLIGCSSAKYEKGDCFDLGMGLLIVEISDVKDGKYIYKTHSILGTSGKKQIAFDLFERDINKNGLVAEKCDLEKEN